MFEDMLVSADAKIQKTKKWTFFVSFTVEAVIVVIIVLVPLVFPKQYQKHY